jgi:hypothetical protein
VIPSDYPALALNSAQWIIGGSLIAVIVLLFCIRALNRPSDSRPGPFVEPPPAQTAAPPEPITPPASKAARSPGFSLPPPSQAQPMDEASLNPVPSIGHYSFLVFRNGAHKGEKISLDRFPNGTCAIGRSDVPENQIKIRDDNKVSRVSHAIITRDTQGLFYIQDNDSVNKVYVNDQCIETKKIALQNGDKIRVGLTEFDYVNESPS